MKLTNTKEVQAFIEAVKDCRGGVYLKSPEGEVIKLENERSLCAGIGLLLRPDGDSVELFTGCREDESRMLGFLCDLDRSHRLDTAA